MQNSERSVTLRASPNIRIQWFHSELVQNTYPNAVRLAERFHMSRRQAQRDIDFLRTNLGAPLVYDQHRMGYMYETPFTLPIAITSENDDTFTRLADNLLSPCDNLEGGESLEVDSIIIQSQIPYTAMLGIQDKLTVLEMRKYIISEEQKDTYLCEFHNIDRFLCHILTARSGIRILEPTWLRDKLLHMAQKAITNNS
jgi:hypothetical protein